jgi:hypothetical protein
MAMTKIYQVLYCDSKFWDARKSLMEQVERAFRWYLIKCPLIGIGEIVSARDVAKDLKAEFGARAQVIIMGDVRNQSEGRTADDLLGLTVLRGSDATECEDPSIVFTKKGKRPVFYSREEDLGYGHFPPTFR